MYDTVLIPTDGSEAATAARHGIAFAEAFDATVHVLSVVDVRAFSDRLPDIDQLAREQRSALEDRAREAADAVAELVANTADLAYESTVEDGVPHEVILAHADDHDVDLIAMGTHGRSGLERFLLGSVTERVLRRGRVPVLAVPTSADTGGAYGSILIPTDGSPAARAAVDDGLGVAEIFDASVYALYVIRTDRGLPDPGDPARASAEEAVESVAAQGASRLVEVSTHIESGSPHERIHKFVDTHGIDLVAMGTHGRSGISRHLIGSVTERVLRTSDVPVLTVRDGQA